MRLLVLGGTVFLGRAFTDAALDRGHSVTHLNRGRSAPADARVETLTGDRSVAPLPIPRERRWDAVIDTSGYLPQVVRISVDALRELAGQYVFVSSISVYRDVSAPFDESAPVLPPPDPLPDALQMELYGALKSGCEDVVRETFGDRALVVRPGLIVGPHDRSDRFTYWPHRAARGGLFAAPGRPARPVQFIDVRDLAEWILAMVEARAAGTYNVTGPAAPIAMGSVIDACIAAAGNDARAQWLDEAFLAAHSVQPWMEMPLWLPESDPANGGFMAADISRALARGLSFRPLEATVADTLAWSRTRPADHAWRAGLAPEREGALLEAWQRR